MEDLRTKFKNGERPDGCQSCWQEEDAGKTSKRQNSIYKMNKSLQNWTPNSEPSLKFIDFKLGNVCNLKCRICGSWSSSKWAQEEIDYEIAKGEDNPLAKKQLKEGGWPKRNPQFFEELKDRQYFRNPSFRKREKEKKRKQTIRRASRENASWHQIPKQRGH